MKRLLALLVLSSLSSSLEAQLSARQGIIAFTHVTVIDVPGGPALSDSTVVVAGDRIAQVGTSGEVFPPANAESIDATGKFLIPGLWDMHTHPDEVEYLPQFIANGVTGIRVMWGKPYHHEWRKEIESGTLLGPRMLIASNILDGPKPNWPGSVAIADASQARQAVIRAKEEGADFLKVYSYLPREAYFAIVDEARRQGIPVEGHVPDSVSAEEASNAGQKSFEHLLGVLPACSTWANEWDKAALGDLLEQNSLEKPAWNATRTDAIKQRVLDGYSADKAAALFALLKKNGTWQCPTLTVLHKTAFINQPSFSDDPRLKYVPRETRAWWYMWTKSKRLWLQGDNLVYTRKEFEKELEIVGSMQRAGVGLLAGTGQLNAYCFPGFSLHDELGLLG